MRAVTADGADERSGGVPDDRAFGIPLRVILSAMRGVGPVSGPKAAVEGFARAAWSVLCEPGDGVAGALIAAMGAAGALDLLMTAEREGRSALAPASGELAPKVLAAAWERWRPRLSAVAVLRALDAASHLGARLLWPGADDWPDRLDDLGPHAPIALWCRGRRPEAARDDAFALVGARACSGYGEHVTAELAEGLVARGAAIVSGGAYGIDGVAHRAALAAGGSTLAVLAGGIDRLYPAGHEGLLHRVIDGHAVYSEVPPGASPTRWRFLQRNRIIAALGQATIVAEAGARSGSLNTAGHASALGRPLGAVPGPVTSATSAGCHRLLREYDAVCVTGVEDAWALVHPDDTGERREGELSPGAFRVRDLLTGRPARTDEIAVRAGLSLGDTLAGLAELELAGLATETATGWSNRPARP